MVERRREQQDEAVAAPDEILLDRRHRPLGTRRVRRRRTGRPTTGRSSRSGTRCSAAEPSGVPSSKKARRYQSPSQPSRSSGPPQRLHVGPPALAASRVAAGLGDGGERGQDRVQEPAQPDALAPALVADAVHPVVPVAGPDERQPVRADRRGSASMAAAQCSNSEADSGRAVRAEVGVGLVRPERRALRG